jgi:hypothetical protein
MARVEQITYFPDTSAWRQNTKAVVEIVASHLKASKVKHVVAASCTGFVGAQFAPLKRANPGVTVAAVKMAPAIDKIYDVKVSAAHKRTMEQAGGSSSRHARAHRRRRPRPARQVRGRLPAHRHHRRNALPVLPGHDGLRRDHRHGYDAGVLPRVSK